MFKKISSNCHKFILPTCIEPFDIRVRALISALGFLLAAVGQARTLHLVARILCDIADLLHKDSGQ
jgi:hypothetical protein